MATPLAYTARYTHPVSAIRAALTIEQYWHDRLAQVGGPNAQIKSISITDERIHVEMTQAVPAEQLPTAITAIRPGDLVILRTEIWTGDTATFTAQVTGAPAHIQGTITLTGEDDQTTATVAGRIEVRIPLFGGKIEATIAEHLQRLLAEETEFTNTWLVTH